MRRQVGHVARFTRATHGACWRAMGHVASDDMAQQQEPTSGRTSADSTDWDLDTFQYRSRCQYAMVVLNRPVCWRGSKLLKLWQGAQLTVTVDGGTHRWLEYLKKQKLDVFDKDDRYLPDIITGDMDSCEPSLINKLKNLGTLVMETPDQDNTDYTKALMQLAHYIKTYSIDIEEIYVVVDTSGRFDHIIGNINTLYKVDKLGLGNIRVKHVACDSLTWMLKPGLHRIHVPEILVREKSWCGLLPFGCPVNCISTTGLKWNLNNTTMQYGGLISTSNTFESCEVTVNTDTSVIWTMGIESLIK
ncbi:PREDICTED: thiamin pyrophosphokinase 1 isoform X2 [Vollenhovia emeryi]|uniref:thiamin pyrophosphokinase 1 isoform X2 n=1 Tax=Vollenhovia emeryi TaxID=411798 RepID=UPI0005F4563F|nr:PREDICTED: thiamin pyrophosphokinase 1 isoform X2 [Vollenhovia emeryi]